MRRRRIPVPRFALTTQVYLWAVLFVLIFVLATIAAWVVAGDQALADTQRELDLQLYNLGWLLDESTQDLVGRIEWITVQPDFVNAVLSRDDLKLQPYFDPALKANMAESITLADTAGTVLLRVSRNEPPSKGDNILQQPGILDALSGQIVRGFRKDRFGRLRAAVIHPVYEHDGGAIIGVIMTDVYVDDSSLQRAKPNQGNGILFFYLDGTALSLFEDNDHTPWLNSSPPAPILNAARAGQASDFITLPTVKGSYRFKFNPLLPLGKDFLGAYGVGLPVTATNKEQNRLFAIIAGVCLLLAVAVLVAAYSFQRRFVKPLNALREEVRQTITADLARKLDLNDDPMGLGTQVEALRERLYASYASLLQQKDRYEAILQSLGVAVVIVDESDQVVQVNPAAESLLRQTRGELAAQKWREILFANESTDEEASLLGRTQFADSARGMALVIEGRYVLRRDPRIVLHVISEPLRIGERQAGFIHVLQDASEHEEFIRSKDEFIVNAAHELRGPLASLRASIETLIEEQHTLTKMELNFMLKNMQRAVVRFQSFAENLVDMGNVIAGRFMVRPFPSQLDEIIETAISQVASLLDVRGQTLHQTNNCTGPVRVFADRPRVVQVLVNLLTNASKYGPEGESIHLAVSADERYVTIEVADHGAGIAPEEQARLFERFYRGKRALVDGSGLGIGLALAKEIVEAHGGRIEVKSQIGEGSTFWFTLLKA
jgi:PAS domain S-box-containing protein